MSSQQASLNHSCSTSTDVIVPTPSPQHTLLFFRPTAVTGASVSGATALRARLHSLLQELSGEATELAGNERGAAWPVVRKPGFGV